MSDRHFFARAAVRMAVMTGMGALLFVGGMLGLAAAVA